jgi:predicted nucleotidyltransferase component of viral defense system
VVLFREALAYTMAETGFSERLIERDYFCSVLLSDLAPLGADLVFKGGTCLAKVHADFYRMSEDLDFAISAACNLTRKQRSLLVEPLKRALEKLADRLPVFRVRQPLRGANASRQYLAEIEYTSLNTNEQELIKLEVGLREPLLTATSSLQSRTILLNPISARPLVSPVTITCLSLLESLAEKFRAALSRREPAIRDFFDIDYAVRRLGVHVEDPALARLVRQKLEIPGNETVDVSVARFDLLGKQVLPQLKPVLRESDYREFDPDRSFDIARDMADRIMGTE